MIISPLITVGLMLTMAGLVGSFFNIQLSQWLRDLMALDQKVTLSMLGSTEEKRKTLVECKIELKRLFNFETYVVNSLVVAFVVFVLVNGLLILPEARSDPAHVNVVVAFWTFLILFTGLSVWLMVRGSVLARSIQRTLYPVREPSIRNDDQPADLGPPSRTPSIPDHHKA